MEGGRRERREERRGEKKKKKKKNPFFSYCSWTLAHFFKSRVKEEEGEELMRSRVALLRRTIPTEAGA